MPDLTDAQSRARRAEEEVRRLRGQIAGTRAALHKVAAVARALYDVIGADEHPQWSALGAALDELAGPEKEPT